MALTRLQEDLLREFKEERQMIGGQINLFDPLATSLRRPVAHRLANAGLMLLGELLCWLCVVGAAAFIIFIRSLPTPLYTLFTVDMQRATNPAALRNLQWAVYGMVAVIALLFLFLARALRRIRLKNGILFLAGSRIKTLVGQLLERKAAIDAIEQRHFLEIPGDVRVDVNAVGNPGYES